MAFISERNNQTAREREKPIAKYIFKISALMRMHNSVMAILPRAALTDAQFCLFHIFQ